MQRSCALLQGRWLNRRGMMDRGLQDSPVLGGLPPGDRAAEGLGGAPANGETESAEPPADTKVEPTAESNGEPVDDFQAELERLAELSEEWRDHFSAAQVAPLQSRTPEDDERPQVLFDSLTVSQTLRGHLLGTAHLSAL